MVYTKQKLVDVYKFDSEKFHSHMSGRAAKVAVIDDTNRTDNELDINI